MEREKTKIVNPFGWRGINLFPANFQPHPSPLHRVPIDYRPLCLPPYSCTYVLNPPRRRKNQQQRQPNGRMKVVGQLLA